MARIGGSKPETVTLRVEVDSRLAEALRALGAERNGAALPLQDARDILDAAIQGQESEALHLRAARQIAYSRRAVVCGGVTLPAPTLRARTWLQEIERQGVPEAWAEYPAEWACLAHAFVLAHQGDPDVLAHLVDPTQAVPIIEYWARGFDATPAEVSAALQQLSISIDPLPAEKKSTDAPPWMSDCSYASYSRRLAAQRLLGWIDPKQLWLHFCAAIGTGNSAAPRPRAPIPITKATPDSGPAPAGETSGKD